MPTRSEPLQWGLQPLTVFFKYGEDERIGESVEAIGDEDAPAYIRQKMGVHVNPVIAHSDDPEDCKRKEQISEICLFAFDYVCQHGKGQHDRGLGHVTAGPGPEGALILEIRDHFPPVSVLACGIVKCEQILVSRTASDGLELGVDQFAEDAGEQDHGTDGEQHVRMLIVEDQIRQPGRQTCQSNPGQESERQGEKGTGLPRNIAVSLAKVIAACIKKAVKRPEQGEAQHTPRQSVESASLFLQPLEQAHARYGIEQMGDDIAEVLMKIADGSLVGKRHGNLVIVKAADDDSNGQNGTDYIKYITRHTENSLFCHINYLIPGFVTGKAAM